MTCISSLKALEIYTEVSRRVGFKLWNHSARIHQLVVNPDSGFSVGAVLGGNLLPQVDC